MTAAAPPPALPVKEGDVLAGKYRVERVLGQGGMGVVVAAEHLQLRQKVAIKFLLPGANHEVTTRFLREARAAVRLKSAHVARVLDVGDLATGAPYMVMEHLDGSDLSHVIRRRGALPVVDAVDYVLQACEAIAEAHVAGIVHRDLKPANLFLTTGADGSATVKVLDFGISKDSADPEGAMALTRTTAMLGSPHYMAPEQMRSTRTVDARADIWSLGVILYQLVTKTVPFKAGTFVELVLKVNQEDAPSPLVHRPDLPPALVAAILHCLERNPDRRFATVAELAAAIAPFGRSEAASSAARIARTQGAVPRSIERPSGVLPTPSMLTGPTGPSLTKEPTLPHHAVTPPPGSSVPPASGVAGATGGRATAGASVPPAPKTGELWGTNGATATTVDPPRGSGGRAIVAGVLLSLIVGGVGLAVFLRARAPVVVAPAASTPPANEAAKIEPRASEASPRPSPSVEASAVSPPASVEAPALPASAKPPPPKPSGRASAGAPSTTTIAPPPATAPAATATASSKKKNPLDMEIQ